MVVINKSWSGSVAPVTHLTSEKSQVFSEDIQPATAGDLSSIPSAPSSTQDEVIDLPEVSIEDNITPNEKRSLIFSGYDGSQ